MAKPGPKPKSAELKRAQGNPGNRPIKSSAIEIKPERPKRPTGLDRVANKFFDEVADKLAAVKAITSVDGPGLSLAATHWAIALEAAKAIKTEGLTVKGYRGSTVKNPLLAVLNQNSEAYRKWAAEYGLTPSARARMTADDDSAKQLDLAGLLFEKVSEVINGEE